MQQIKTIFDTTTAAFDKKVNDALAEGWRLTKRLRLHDGFLAELEQETITEDERTCENCKHYDRDPGLPPCCDCNDGPLEGWEPAS